MENQNRVSSTVKVSLMRTREQWMVAVIGMKAEVKFCQYCSTLRILVLSILSSEVSVGRGCKRHTRWTRICTPITILLFIMGVVQLLVSESSDIPDNDGRCSWLPGMTVQLYCITSNLRCSFYTFFPVEKLRCVLNSRNVYLLIFFLKPTFRNWMRLKLEGVL
jgi:hypothetical protein